MVEIKSRINSRRRILIADDDTHCARQLANYLTQYGYEVLIVRTISEAKEKVLFWHPQTVFINLLLPETNAMSLVRYIHSKFVTEKPFITVMSKQAVPETVDSLRRAGTDHYLLKPFALEEALGIVIENAKQPMKEAPLVSPAKVTVAIETPKDASMRELHLLNLFLKQAMNVEMEKSLFNLMRMINAKVNGIRCSLIRCVNDDSAIIMASNDDEHAHGLPIDLSQYPEIRAVWERHKAVVIPDVQASELLNKVRRKLLHTPFETIAIFPVYCRGTFYGVLSLRMEKKEADDISYIEKFGNVCSRIISLSITNPN